MINPSSNTAQGSFHGTGISIFQLPSHSNSGIVRNSIIIEGAPLITLSLPGEYVNVPAVSCKTDQLSVPQLAFSNEGASVLDAGKAGGNGLNMACTYSPRTNLRMKITFHGQHFMLP